MTKEICFSCLMADCPSHCCKTYNGISPNLHPLGNVSMTEIVLLPTDVKRLQEAGCENLIVVGKDDISRIRTAPDGTCSALCDGVCSIYEHRPAICRAYPLYLDLYTGVCLLKECPAVPKNATVEDFPNELKNLLDIYNYWITRYSSIL